MDERLPASESMDGRLPASESMDGRLPASESMDERLPASEINYYVAKLEHRCATILRTTNDLQLFSQTQNYIKDVAFRGTG